MRNDSDSHRSPRLWIGNLHPRVSETDLRSRFEQYGYIDLVARQSNYAFVHFVARDDMERALLAERGRLTFFGKKAIVDRANRSCRRPVVDYNDYYTCIDSSSSSLIDEPVPHRRNGSCDSAPISDPAKFSDHVIGSTYNPPTTHYDIHGNDNPIKPIMSHEGAVAVPQVLHHPACQNSIKIEIKLDKAYRNPLAFKKLIEALQELDG